MVFERFFNYYDATCPPPPPLSEDQAASESANLLKAAGIRSCETSQMSMTAEAHIKVPYANAGMSMTANSSSTIGCEQVSVITEKYRKAINNTTCLLKEQTNSTKNTMTGINSIKFKAGRDLEIDCSTANPNGDGLNINQNMQLDMVSTVQLKQEQVEQIQNACKDVVTSALESAKESKTGLGATPQGQKTIIDKITDIQQNDYKASINKSINEVSNKMNGSNEILLETGRDLRISGSRCKFEQDMVLKMIASSVVDSTLSDMMGSLSDTINDTVVKDKQTSDNKGADDLAKAVKTDDSMDKNTMYAVIAVAVVLVVGGIIGLVMMNKKDDQPQYAQPQYAQYPPSGRIRGSSYSPLIKNDIDPKYIFAAILLAIIYMSNNREKYQGEKVYNF